MYANNAGTGYANANIFYLFLGAQQQWGFTADSMSILFPMAFSSTSYILLSDIQVTSGGNILAAYIYQNTKTISGANFAYSYRRNWIAIGCQPQWGYSSSRTATFPIPFPTAALFVVAIPKTTSTSATATGAEYLGTTSVNLYLHGTSGWYFVGGH